MAVVFSSGFESGGTADWSITTGSPTVITSDKVRGSYGLETSIATQAQHVTHVYATEPSVAVIRLYVKYTAVGSPSFSTTFASTYNQAQTRDVTFLMRTDASNNPRLLARIYDGVANYEGTLQAISVNAWYRFEAKVDMSAAAWAVTWGYAQDDNPLTTVDNGFTGGNNAGATTADAWLVGQTGSDTRTARYDEVSISGTAADYPIGVPASSATNRSLLLGV